MPNDKEDSTPNETELAPSLRDELRQEGSPLTQFNFCCVAHTESYLFQALETELAPMANVYFPNKLFIESLLLLVLVLPLSWKSKKTTSFLVLLCLQILPGPLSLTALSKAS